MKLGMLQAYGMLFSLAILFNVFIAALLSISPENCCGDESLTFVDNFYFTFQTFATIGYGTLSPVGIWANFLTFAIQIVYVFWMTITGGMVVTKFLASGAQIDFSEQLVINQEGKFPELMIRVANAHMNVYTIHHCSATIRLLLNTGSYSSINLLKLESDQADRLLVWTLSHEINQESPLYGLTFEDLIERSARFIVSFQGVDELTGGNVYHSDFFDIRDVLFGWKFVDQFNRDLSTNEVTIDLSKTSQYAPAPVSVPLSTRVT